MKKILHISKYYYPFSGGTEQIARDVVLALKGEYEQKVIAFNDGKEDKLDIVDGIEVTKCGCFTKIAAQSLSVSYGKHLHKVMKEFNPDIVVFHCKTRKAMNIQSSLSQWTLLEVKVQQCCIRKKA